jgi:hypothetical protein
MPNTLEALVFNFVLRSLISLGERDRVLYAGKERPGCCGISGRLPPHLFGLD